MLTTRIIRRAAWVVLSLLGLPALAAEANKPPRLAFNRDIRPILSENCYACHGPDKNKRKAKLRLDERESATASGAIVPGKPDDSELIARILSDEAELVMPPPSSHKTLTSAQKELLKRWIAEGAEYQAHWAYVPLQRPAIPVVKKTSWVRNPIDAFVLSALEARGIAPSAEAGRGTLIRRLSLDLIGLPPTPEEVREFEADTDPRAYERLVDRLLESPHYGERMAVPWLDLVRFADTVGYHGDQGQRIFPYRDYVIDAFNRNLPFDRFTTEQLAGDLLPSPTPEQLVATGFNRLNMMTREGGAQPGEYLAKYAGDRVRTVAVTWLGSTMGCAECHDHKYDPFTMRDFYSLAAFFADIKQWGVYQDYDYTPNPELKGWSNDHPFPPEIQVESPYLKRRRVQLQQRISQVCQAAVDRDRDRPGGREALEDWVRESAAFAAAHPTGWKTPEAVEAGGAKPQPDGSLLLAAPSVPGDWKVVLKPGAGRLARIRLELLPDPAFGGKITRDQSASTTIRMAAEVGPKGGPAQPLAFFHAAADRKGPRYFNGDEIPGVLDGWITDPEQPTAPHTAIWSLDSPMPLADGDILKIRLSGRPGRVRIAVSPFGIDPAGRPALDGRQRAALVAGADSRTPEQSGLVEELYVLANGPRFSVWNQVKSLCSDLLACGDGRTFTMVTRATTPMVTRILPRGNWQDQSGPIVEPAVPRFLPQPAAGSPGRRLTRLDLARWITAADNPLTARVFVNRLWKQFFGTGISSLVEDIGAQGEWPVHPELLDWLACEFRDGWDVKRMVKLLVTSAAYRQEARARPELREIDPGNRLVAAQTPRRLEAEFVRDNALAIAGLLNRDIGGPSVFPYQPAGYYANLQFPDRDYIANTDDRQYRRGVYMHWQRTFLHPMLANFDAPPREECTGARNVANTPQQALTLLNDPTFVEAARVLAGSLLTAGLASDSARLDLLYQRALARPPRDGERSSLLEYLATQRTFYQAHHSDAAQLVRVGISPVPAGLSELDLAAWTMACRVVLGLHETITRY